jgi:NAD(P)-dependent dehydrogenase (short-subunit alcohol dehydrogenase family)
LDVVKATPSSRIVTVSSDAHRGAKLHFDDLCFQKGYGAFKAYSQSKLANIVFTYELARRLDGSGVTANCLHPGVIASGFGQTYSGAFSILIKMIKPFLATTEAGARTSVYLASSPEVREVTGKYFAKCKPVRSNAVSYDEASWRRLWEVSEEMTQLPATPSP